MKPRILHVVPTFDNPKTIGAEVAALAAASAYPILVVDDGSLLPVQPLVRQYFSERHLGCDKIFFLRFERNQGKGVALQHAFDWALEHDYTHALSSDADGQHPASEVLKVAEASAAHPWAFVIGHRNMDTAHVPDISKFGRKFSNYWVRYQTDRQVADSQSGLRCYPLIFLQNSKFFSRRFDFEIEVLIRLIWKQVEIKEVPVEVVYHAPQERVTHFDKVWDNARITMLNTVLIVLSLLKEKSSPVRLAAALGLGIFIGCTPFYGFHTLLAAGASFFFRLNFIALFVGSHVSLPPFLPFLISGALALGHWVHGHGGPVAILIGSVILGTLLGVAGFLISWRILSRRQKMESARVWRGEQRGGRWGNGFLKLLMRTLGLRAAYACVMIFVVPYFYLFSPKSRRASAGFWRVIEPELSFFGRQRRILRHLYRFASVLLDSVYISMKGPTAFQLESIGYTELQSAVGRQRGVLMLTAHCGAWSVSARAIGRHGLRSQFFIVRYEDEGLTLAKVQGSTFSPREIVVNSQSMPVLEIRQALQSGNIVSLMGDRPLGRRLELVKFLGKWVVADLSPFRTALACESAIFFGFGFQKSFRHYFFQVGELPVPARTADKDAQAHALAQEFYRTLEGFIRQYPEQWFNWYDYFTIDKATLSFQQGPAPTPQIPHVLGQQRDVQDDHHENPGV